jgi:hypothetical protein
VNTQSIASAAAAQATFDQSRWLSNALKAFKRPTILAAVLKTAVVCLQQYVSLQQQARTSAAQLP